MTNRALFRFIFLIFCVIGVAVGFRVLLADDQEVEMIRESLELDPGDVVADIGAGDGKWLVALASIVGESGHVYGTEIDSKDLKRIRERVEKERLANVTVIEGTATSSGLEEACCDAILLRRVYHHFTDPEAMRRSMAAALRPDGRLLIVDFDTRSGWRRPKDIPESRSGHGIGKEVLREEMEAAGFVLLDDRSWRRGDYALVFGPPRLP